MKEVEVESKKVSWPTRNELRDSTIVVIIAVIILTAFVYVVDTILRFGLGLLLR
jgi:preprotein translocase subunit SecE